MGQGMILGQSLTRNQSWTRISRALRCPRCLATAGPSQPTAVTPLPVATTGVITTGEKLQDKLSMHAFANEPHALAPRDAEPQSRTVMCTTRAADHLLLQ